MSGKSIQLPFGVVRNKSKEKSIKLNLPPNEMKNVLSDHLPYLGHLENLGIKTVVRDSVIDNIALQNDNDNAISSLFLLLDFHYHLFLICLILRRLTMTTVKVILMGKIQCKIFFWKIDLKEIDRNRKRLQSQLEKTLLLELQKKFNF